jgi:hypothetical protein
MIRGGLSGGALLTQQPPVEGTYTVFDRQSHGLCYKVADGGVCSIPFVNRVYPGSIPAIVYRIFLSQKFVSKLWSAAPTNERPAPSRTSSSVEVG